MLRLRPRRPPLAGAAGFAAVTAVVLTAALAVPGSHAQRPTARPAAGAPVTRPAPAVPASRPIRRIPPGIPVGGAATRSGHGLWVADTDATVVDEGSAVAYRHRAPAGQPVIAVASAPGVAGYWLLGADGAVSTAGAARAFGSPALPAGSQPPVGIALRPDGRGYWILGRYGAVYPFGAARAEGSAAGTIASPASAIVADPSGPGYWIVTRRGRVLGFGGAPVLGGLAARPLDSPVVGMGATPTGRGYWLLERSGRVVTFGRTRGYGGLVRPVPAVGLIGTVDHRGYWILYADGHLAAFGDARAVPTVAVPSSGDSLVGQVVTIDPGHNGGNGADPSYINQPVPSGPGTTKACDTTGTETDAGYTEASFNFDVATRLAAELRGQGATVVLTRTTNTGVGPCVDIRAAIGNEARSDVAISIHADGGPASGRGFAVLEPALFPGYNDAVIAPSDRFAVIVRNTFETLIEPSTYDGVDGLQVRDDLAGLNLSTVPKVLIECANMRNATDAALVTDPAWRQAAADRLDAAFTTYLTTATP